MRPLLESSLGRKALVALTGTVLTLFLVGHLAGNLLVYGGQDAFNGYARWLHERPGLVWAARAVLFACLVLHVRTTILLKLGNRAARPDRYAKPATVQADLPALSMLWTGALVLAYLVYHLLHFTVGVIQAENFGLVDEQNRRDAFAMLVRGFQNPLVSLSYVVAMLLLGLHLAHGVASLFQTLGVSGSRYESCLRPLGRLFTTALVVAFCSIPIAVLLGAVALEGQVPG